MYAIRFFRVEAIPCTGAVSFVELRLAFHYQSNTGKEFLTNLTSNVDYHYYWNKGSWNLNVDDSNFNNDVVYLYCLACWQYTHYEPISLVTLFFTNNYIFASSYILLLHNTHTCIFKLHLKHQKWYFILWTIIFW